MLRYQSKRGCDQEIRDRLRELGEQRPRFGYRRLHVLLRREGETLNLKKTRRLYREEKLHLRPKKRRLKRQGEPVTALIAVRAHQLWTLDFINGTLACGRPFRTLNVMDGASRAALAIEADTSLSAHRVVRVLEELRILHGAPGVASGQRAGVPQSGSGCVGAQARRRTALHPTRQTNPERPHRIVQWQTTRRMLEPEVVHLALSRSLHSGSVERGLQHRAPAQRTPIPNAH